MQEKIQNGMKILFSKSTLTMTIFTLQLMIKIQARMMSQEKAILLFQLITEKEKHSFKFLLNIKEKMKGLFQQSLIISQGLPYHIAPFKQENLLLNMILSFIKAMLFIVKLSQISRLKLKERKLKNKSSLLFMSLHITLLMLLILRKLNSSLLNLEEKFQFYYLKLLPLQLQKKFIN